MLGVMSALLAVVILWLGVARPLDAAQRSAGDALREATDRNAAIRAKVTLLKSLPRTTATVDAGVPLEQFIGQRSEEHTSELQSLMRNSYAVFCLKKKKTKTIQCTYVI